MRIATAILGLVYFLLLIPVSCGTALMAGIGGAVTGTTSSYATWMMLTAVIPAIGGAFALKKPLFSMYVFIFGAVACPVIYLFLIRAMYNSLPSGFTGFSMEEFLTTLWWIVPFLLLALTSFLGHKELQRQKFG